MRLDFNVLWIDDQPDRIKAQITRIDRHMVSHGFHFNPKLCTTIEQMSGVLSDDVFDDEIDLVLVDWDLGAGVVGQDAIAKIRDKVRYKDVVFYSAGKDPAELRKLAFEADLEGIYCASRELLVEEVEGVFDALVKKVLDLDHTRGIVMGATSDIDHIIGECLDQVHKTGDLEQQKAIFAKAVAVVRETIESSGKQLTKLEKMTDFGELASQHRIFTAHHRLRVLKDALNGSSMKDRERFVGAIEEYMKNVTPERNILGHVVLVPEGKPQYVMGSDDKPRSLEETRALRSLILALRLDFRELQKNLNGE